jgi:hypothetical protein
VAINKASKIVKRNIKIDAKKSMSMSHGSRLDVQPIRSRETGQIEMVT